MTEPAGQAAGRPAAQTWLIEMLTDAVNHHQQQLDEILSEVQKLVADGSLDPQSALVRLVAPRRRRAVAPSAQKGDDGDAAPG